MIYFHRILKTDLREAGSLLQRSDLSPLPKSISQISGRFCCVPATHNEVILCLSTLPAFLVMESVSRSTRQI